MRFKRVYIEITNTCNLSCHFCIQNHRPARMMNISEFTSIIEQISPYSDYVYLHVMGEPLSHPLLDDFLHVTDAAKRKVNITTNGTLLKAKKDILKQHAIRQINVSLHSFPEHVSPHYLQDVFESCEELAANGIYINYRLWSLKHEMLSSESEDILAVIKERYHMDMERESIHRMQRMALQDHISLHFEDVFTWPSLQHPFVNTTGRCLGMKDMCGILSNGDVVPCCLDSAGDNVLGNVYERSFQDIITSAEAEEIVQGFANHKVVKALCQHCSYRLRFYDK